MTQAVFKLKRYVTDLKKTMKLGLRKNCVVCDLDWRVHWTRVDSENLKILARISIDRDFVEIFQVQNLNVPLPIGCGLAEIGGKKHTVATNACILYRYSQKATDFVELVDHEFDLVDFVGALFLSEKDGLAIKEIIEGLHSNY